MLLKERDDARHERRKNQDEVGVAKDEAKDLKLEHVNKDMKTRIKQSRI